MPPQDVILIFLALAALAVLAAGIYRWRVTSIESRNRQLALEVADRTLDIAEQTADLEALYQADEELERHVQLDHVLQALVNIAVDRLQADKSAVLAWDERLERVAIRVARNFNAQSIAQIQFAPGEGFAWQVMTTGEPVMVEDARLAFAPPDAATGRAPENSQAMQAIMAEGIRSCMHIPIRLAARPEAQPGDGAPAPGAAFGIFSVCYRETRAFGEREQRLFMALAQRAALAVQKAQHFAAEQRRAEQFRVLNEVGRSLTSILEINALLDEIVRLIQRAFGYDHVELTLVEGTETVYRAGAAAPHEPHEGRTRSELQAPLKVAGRVIGALQVRSERAHAFDESDRMVMESLANQAAIAIENARLYQRLNTQVARLTALQETSRAVASTLERDALLKLIMAQATALLQADGGLINLADWKKEADEVVACSGAAAEFCGVRDALKASLSGWSTPRDQPVISNHLDADARVAQQTRQWLEQYRVESAAAAPLVIKGQAVGTLVLIKEAGKGGFEQADLDLLVSFADQAAVAIENAQLYEEAQLVAATQERSRLARDLHDAVTQTLFSASLIAEVLPALWESNPAEGQQLLGELRQLTRGALAEMRALLLELRPAALVEADLGDLLRQLAESVAGRSGIPVAVSIEGCAPPDLPDEVHIALYRIAQEALNNVVKHAEATRAEVALRCARARWPAQAPDGAAPPGAGEAAEIALRITDNGKGFDPGVIAPGHLGLGIIRERGQAIDARLRIESAPGAGAVIEIIWQSPQGEC